MTTDAIARRRKPRGLHPKKTEQALEKSKLPEYLEADEVNAIIRAADDPRSRLLMLEQWRAGPSVSEALALEAADLSLNGDHPTLRVRSSKGGSVKQGRLIDVTRVTAWCWVQAAVNRAEQLGAIPARKQVGTTLFDIVMPGTYQCPAFPSTIYRAGWGTAASRQRSST